MQCYNVGCGKKFEPTENTENSCKYHPTPPVFHDGKKGWDCCKRFSTDFSTCLSTPGCKLGFHNQNKPVEPVKPKLDPKFDVDVVVVTNPVEKRPPRPDGSEEMKDLSMTENPNLRAEINRHMAMNGDKSDKDLDSNEQKIVPMGTNCKNNGCRQKYTTSEMNKEVCIYHSGEPIFHEGMKYWTCCQRRTSDFDAFMVQEGCASGQHVWFKKVLNTDCRVDWFQSGPNVTITLYAKMAMPDTIVVKANSVTLFVSFDFDFGSLKYENVFNLLEEIEVDNSQVRVSNTKVEIVLKKKMMFNWTSLQVARK